MELDGAYWESRWKDGLTGWDIGHVSTPIKEYCDQLPDKNIDILIPGCGRSWEGEYLHQQGFTNVYLLDIAPTALQNFHDQVPTFPAEHLILGDFFQVEKTFDLIIEQTFFCALDPTLRTDYIAKASSLLKKGGKLIGLLFETDFGNDHPPFGGTKEEYSALFSENFNVQVMERAHNSIAPRSGTELFMIVQKL